MANSAATVIKFQELCQTFANIVKAKKAEKNKPLVSFIKMYKAKAEEMHLDLATNGSFYPALRLILPHCERERGAYGLKEFSLAKKFIKILCLPPQGTDAKRLSDFRSTPNNSTVKDFADSAFTVLRKQFMNGSRLSLADVNEYLDAIAQKNSENDPRGLENKLFELLRSTSADEQRWLIRIILKDVRLGMGQDRILNQFHPDAADFYSSNNSLSKVCEILTDPSIRLHEIQVSLFSPFQPMLSQKCDAAQFRKLMSSNMKLFVENKFDGERFQLHMSNGQFKYFSRNGYEYSKDYGETYSSGVFTPKLRNVFKCHIGSIILDGEMMGWNTRTKKFGSKGMNFDVKRLKADSTHQPCFCVFDILLLNGEVLTNKPLKERVGLLNTLLKPVQGVFLISHSTTATMGQEILTALNRSMDREEEGIVFKDIESCYKSNDRKAGWWKIKLEYFENVMNDLDVIIMGGYYGDGRHRRRISGFLVAVAVPPSKDRRTPSHYLSFARIASGLSHEELEVTDKKLGLHWKKLNEGSPEDFGLEWGKEKPDVWIPPEKSLILQIRASEMIRSSDFKTEYTLRFPRIQKIRLDKSYYDCLTTTELHELTTSSKAVTKLNNRHLELSDLEAPEKERKFKKRYVPAEIQPVEQRTDFLSGYEFCILTGMENWSKEKVEMEIRENGGSVVRNEGRQTLCLLVGDDHPRVNSCKLAEAPYDLVKLQWIRKVLDNKVLELYSPREVLHASEETRNRFLEEYDEYGDSYTDDATVEDVQEFIDIIEKSGDYIHPTLQEMEDMDEALNLDNPLNVFRGYVAYFSDPEDCDIEQMEFKFLGGTVNDSLDENVSLVVISNHCDSKKQEIQRRLNERHNNHAEIVEKNYISERFLEVKASILQ